MNIARLHELLNRFEHKKILVIGDFFLDKWLSIDRDLDEPSVETGLTAYQVVSKRICPGAAGTVTNNLSALGIGKIIALGAIGNDGEGYELLKGLAESRVDTQYLVRSDEIFTPSYIKPLFKRPGTPEETHRLDIRNRSKMPASITEKIIENLYSLAGEVDAIISLDQVSERNTGVISDPIRSALDKISSEHENLIIYGDSRDYPLEYNGLIIKCNHIEALRAMNIQNEQPTFDEILSCAKSISMRTGKRAVVTWGSNGMIVANGEKAVHAPAVKVEGPIDICGAGDGATAGFISALCSGATDLEAALVGNISASITIQQIGTTGTVNQAQIIDRFNENADYFLTC